MENAKSFFTQIQEWATVNLTFKKIFLNEQNREATLICELCKNKKSFTYKTYHSYDTTEFERQMTKLGWKALWLTNYDCVCPTCISKLTKAIVPGKGVKLVTKAMIEQGKAFPLKDFNNIVASKRL